MTEVTAAVPSAPEPSGPGPGRTDTVTWAEFTRSIGQAQRTGLCTRPVRLRGQIAAIDLATGELRPVYDTATDEPGGVLHVPCGNRRETVCPPCSTVYKRDARQLVRAGLTGGKGVPETIISHPCVFATFTAPSFGPVHARRMRSKTVLPCRPRRDHKVRRCPHGRDISCPVRHGEHDPRLGRALCPDCYDYRAAVLFNAHAGVLWRRFTTYLPRHLARLTGLTQQRLRALVRVRYVKVAEYQARGVVHFHAVIRLDRAPDVGGEHLYDPPDPHFTTTLLCDAIAQAVAAVAISVGPDLHPAWPALTLRFGAQVDTKPIVRGDGLPGTGRKLSVQAVGNYIAKYATKALDAPGLPDRPLRSSQDIAALRCNRHYRAMITIAWRLGGGKLAPARTRLCKWAHTLGHGGHFLTKSRHYSVTFGQLRRARTEHRKRQRHPGGEHDPWGRPIDETTVLIVENWAYHGTGYATTPAAELALASAARARDHEQGIRAA
jgi:Replication initiator protein, pSAM2